MNKTARLDHTWKTKVNISTHHIPFLNYSAVGAGVELYYLSITEVKLYHRTGFN
jgi:hypothetical protein